MSEQRRYFEVMGDGLPSPSGEMAYETFAEAKAVALRLLRAGVARVEAMTEEELVGLEGEEIYLGAAMKPWMATPAEYEALEEFE